MEDKYKELVIKLAIAIQRLEREGIDITVDDIKTVWEVKQLLGYSIPISTYEGTGALIINPYI